METTNQLTSAFLKAAVALAARMISELQSRDVELANKVAAAVEQGEQLSIAFVHSSPPRVELAATSDYDSRRVVATIPLKQRPAISH